VLDSNPVLAETAENTCQNRALTRLVVTFSATPNQICWRKSILLDWLVGRARVWLGFEADLRRMGLFVTANQAMTCFDDHGGTVQTPPLAPQWVGSGPSRKVFDGIVDPPLRRMRESLSWHLTSIRYRLDQRKAT
jgi:hypothetical protein